MTCERSTLRTSNARAAADSDPTRAADVLGAAAFAVVGWSPLVGATHKTYPVWLAGSPRDSSLDSYYSR